MTEDVYDCVTNLSFVPASFKQVEVPGRGDSLFRCLSLWLEGTKQVHAEIREAVIGEMLKDPRKYNVQERNTLKIIKVNEIPWSNACS